MSCRCPRKTLLADLGKALACQHARCEALRSSNAKLSAELRVRVEEGGWQVKYEREIRRHQQMVRRMEELEGEGRVNCDILFEDFWREESVGTSRRGSKSTMGHYSRTNNLISS